MQSTQLATYIEWLHEYAVSLLLCFVNVSLCMGGSKGKAGIQLKCIPVKRDTTEMHPGKVMHIIVWIDL